MPRRVAPPSFFSVFLNARSQLWEFLWLVVGISAAVNLLSSVIFEICGPELSLALGLLITFLVLAIIGRRHAKSRVVQVETEANLCFLRRKPHSPIEYPGYYFSNRLCEIATAIFHENPALGTQWMEDAPKSESSPVAKSPSRPQARDRLTHELSEYILLDKLSTHLEDYFNRSHFDRSRIAKYERQDLSDIVLGNRVLELVSRDMTDRPAFDSITENRENIVMAVEDGAYYSRFDLTLPAGSRIHREPDGTLIVDGPVMKIELSVSLGWAALVPSTYAKYILGHSGDLSCRTINLSIKVTAKKVLRTSRRTWQYYGWIESFVREFEADFSINEYFDRINWHSASIVLLGLDNIQLRS